MPKAAQGVTDPTLSHYSLVDIESKVSSLKWASGLVTFMNGKVVHFEVPAAKLKRAQSFYKDVFGWQIMEMPEFNYTMVGTTPSDKNGMPTEAGAINGGMMKRTARFKGPIITIQVADIDAALKEISSHGGKSVVKKTEIGQNMGFTAYFRDTEGNLMGLYQSAG